jgi:hypothetical protein
VRLRILFPSTCVGLRYGHLYTFLAAFLVSMTSTGSHHKMELPRLPQSIEPRLKDSSSSPAALDHRCGLLSLLRPRISNSAVQVVQEC